MISARARCFDTLAILPGEPLAMPLMPDSAQDGYALAEAVPVHHAPAEPEAESDNELVPGAVVRQTGHYKCTACHKLRMASSKSSPKVAVQHKTVLKHFKAGRTFAECPNCGDLTEWQLIEQ